MSALLNYLTAQSISAVEAGSAGVSAELAGLVPEAGWSFSFESNQYSESNYKNLWDNEMRRSVVNELSAAGKTVDDYAAFLGEIHYSRAVIYSDLLFEGGYKDNQGWRLLVLGVPAVQVVAVGLASHYQNAQNHNRLAVASGLFFDAISAAADRTSDGTEMIGRKVAQADWDRTGLFDQPVTAVCGVSLPTEAGAEEPGLWLKEVRTTTVKKTIASYMSVTPVATSSEDASAHLSTAIKGHIRVAEALLRQS